MILMAFTIYDTKTQYFERPFFFQHRAQAIRACADLVTQKDSQLARYPNDFTLMLIGTFDANTGVLSAVNHENLGPLSSFMEAPQQSFKLEP